MILITSTRKHTAGKEIQRQQCIDKITALEVKTYEREGLVVPEPSGSAYGRPSASGGVWGTTRKCVLGASGDLDFRCLAAIWNPFRTPPVPKRGFQNQPLTTLLGSSIE